MKIILASTSPFRKQQLKDLGLSFQAISPEFDEDAFKSKELPLEELCLLLGQKKAESLIKNLSEHIIIGSDQMLVFNNKMYNKPNTKTEVFERLSSLQGNTHTLLTSLYVYSRKKNYSHMDKTNMVMKNLSATEIKNYIELDKPMGCAGGYKYELNGKNLFKTVDSQDPSSIIGLPTLALKSILTQIKGL